MRDLQLKAIAPKIAAAIIITIALIAVIGSQYDMKLSREAAEWVSTWSNTVLIVSAALGVASTILVVWTGNVKEEYLKFDVAHAGENAANAIERAAVLEKDAAEARLETQRIIERLAPRIIDQHQQSRIVDKLRSFAGTEFDVSIRGADPEVDSLLEQIEAILEAAGWKQIAWQSAPVGAAVSAFKRPNKLLVGEVNVSGIVVQMHAEQAEMLKYPGLALAEALLTEGIQARAEPGSGFENGNTKALHVLIGKKP
jgi:hypothetical protein